MIQDNERNKKHDHDVDQSKEHAEIDKLLEETGNYKTKNAQNEQISTPPVDDEEDETLVLSEDLYELVEEQNDEIIYQEQEQPIINVSDTEDYETKELADFSFPQSDVGDDEINIMNDSQIELERFELMMQEGDLQDEVIHSDDSSELQDVSNLKQSSESASDTADLENMIGESLDQYLLNFDETEEEETGDQRPRLESDIVENDDLQEIEEELDFESVESKTELFRDLPADNMLELSDTLSDDDTQIAPQYDLLTEAPYFVEEKTSAHKLASSIMSDIEEYKKDRGITNSFQSSARHLENESALANSNHTKDDFDVESVEDDAEFEDPFAFVGTETIEDNDEDTLPGQPVKEIDHIDDETNSFNKLGTDVINSDNNYDNQIIEENINENYDDSLLLRDSVKSIPESFKTDAESRIIADNALVEGKLREDFDIDDQVGQTTEAFLLNEARKADSEVFTKLYEASDFGILRFDEDEDFKLTEADIKKEMKMRFGKEKGTKAERMIVQYTLMKQKFKKLQTAHKRVLDAMKKAKLYQQQMMPKTPKDLPNLEFGALYKPAEQVSGDFYDFINLDDDQWVVAIGDSAGHGIAPALIMTITKKLLSVFIREGATIAEAMRKTNYYVTQNIPAATFITAVAGIVDLNNATFNFVRAGHPAIILYNPKERGNEPIPHSPSGMALGMDSGRLFNKTLEEETINLLPGDLIVMFTDGVFEISDMNRKRYGMKRFMNLIKDFGSGSVSFLMRKINNSLQEFRAGSTQDDDLSVICLKYIPK